MQLRVEDMTAGDMSDRDGEPGQARTRERGEEEGTSGTDGVDLEVREDMAEKLFDLRSSIRVKVAGCTDDQTMESGGFVPRLPRQQHQGVEEQRKIIERETIRQTWQDLASKLVNFDRWTRHCRRYVDIGPTPRNHMRINVSGTVFDVPRKWIDKFPNSLFCSADMKKLYNPELGVYFIDRNRTAFEHIMQYMASDKKIYQFPDYIPAELLEMELEYYRIGWRFMVGSCKSPPIEEFLNFRSCREKAFAFFNYPESCRAAKVYMYLDLLFILLSIAEFMLLTEPKIQELRETSSEFETTITILKWNCLVFFTADIIARTAASLDRLKFLLDYTTWFDILSLLPFYTDVFGILPEVGSGGEIQLLKMARISRCLKIIRRSETLLMIINILVGCGAELALLGVVWLLGVVISGTLLYFTENQIPVALYNDTRAAYHNISTIYTDGTVTWTETEWFYSILESCWQAVVVIGTVGYGNVYPVYAMGKFVASGIIFLSSLLMAIPMTIIIKRFSEAYEQRAQETRVRKVFGGKFTLDDKHVVEIEDRKVSTRQRQTALCIEKYRSGDCVWRDIKLYVRKMGNRLDRNV